MIGIVASASGTTSEPPSFTKSFCMSTTTRAVRAGSTLTSPWTSYSGTSTLLITAGLLSFVLFSTFFASFYGEYRQHLADEERREDQGGPEDLESDETVAGEPVPEEGGEDGSMVRITAVRAAG